MRSHVLCCVVLCCSVQTATDWAAPTSRKLCVKELKDSLLQNSYNKPEGLIHDNEKKIINI
jgi:hypothetical protein